VDSGRNDYKKVKHNPPRGVPGFLVDSGRNDYKVIKLGSNKVGGVKIIDKNV